MHEANLPALTFSQALYVLCYILFSLSQKPIKEGKRQRRNMPLVCTNHHAVYVPLLLTLSNDVEENPGPRTINGIVDPTYTVHVDFSQGSE